MAPGGDKYIMHAIAKWVGALSSGKETTFDWSDEEGVERMRTILDYDPRFIPPTESPLEKRVPEPWALGRHAVVGMNASDILEEEIKRFAAWAAPTSAETAARQLVIQQTQDFIRTNMIKVVPRVRTQLFGSGATGLALATSDIDIRVYNADNRESWEQRHRAMGHPMRVLASQMGRSEDFMCVTMRWSNYPIINAQHRATGIDIQIVSSPSTAKQEAVTATYLAELPHLRDLFHIMRTMLGMRNLVDVFNGGVGSYGLFIMLVAALKRGQRSSAPPRTVVEQFLHILDFYAHFPLTTDGLTVEPRPKPFKKHPLNSIASGVRQSRIHAASRRSDDARAGQWAIGVLRPLQPYLLCLQDPADPTNDLGRKSNAIKHLQASCQYVLIGVRKKLELVDARRRTEWRQDSILDGVVGRCHEVLQERRRRVEEWGKEKAELEELRRREEGAVGTGEAGGGQEVIAVEGIATEGTAAEGMGEEVGEESGELSEADRAAWERSREAERAELEELRREEAAVDAEGEEGMAAEGGEAKREAVATSSS
ncbi:hypothetical protein B0A55_05350 [Friedmanniomyces simplex]|uniref:Poly(A) RNA polymerase mitochondrial-like central palm domain-containing protein n=1 Tax=Friedmanniomyces simplex TaxID=329884 RepID=A0A4U0XE88_9PEZI|nr:hypothetical protein B0A55_05350 [Friedmanniomyces simplex]